MKFQYQLIIHFWVIGPCGQLKPLKKPTIIKTNL